MKRFTMYFSWALACALSTLACGATDSVIVLVNDHVDTLTVTNAVDSLAIRAGEVPLVTSVLRLQVGDVAELSATGHNALGHAVGSVPVVWDSENPGIASVSSTGVVTALSPGATVIVARAGDVTAVVPTEVEAAPTPGGGPAPTIGTVELAPQGTVIYGVDNTRQFTATARDAQGQLVSSPSLTWATADASVATVTQAGLVRATGLGSTRISVASACCSVDTATVLVEAQGTGPAPDLAFAVDFGTATGKSEDALTDGGRFNLFGFPSDAQLTVVPTAPIDAPGWPTNALELSFLPSTSSLVGITNGWPAPAPGESIYFRYLVYHDMPNGRSISLDHGNQSNIGAIRHQFYLTNATGESPTENHWALGFRAYNGGEYFQYFAADLPERIPLRVEWRLIRAQTGVAARVEIRVYDETISRTVPQWTEFDFVDNYGAGTNSLGARDPVIDMGNESEGFRSYMLGISGSGPSTACCITIGAFAVSLTDWIGPYVPGEAGN